MSKEYSFSVMPSVSISRSRFARKSQHKTSFNLGDIVPIYCDEVLPGDTMSLDMASLVRMSTPIAPIMDNIYIDYFAFFVPNRLVWDHWKEFMGENSVSAGIPSVNYTIPRIASGTMGVNAKFETGSYGDFLGLPVGVYIFNNNISALPFRSIALCYNEWFRDQNLIAPLAIQKGDANEVLVGESMNGPISIIRKNRVLKAAKLSDYFTRALPYAQKGAAVSIPLGSTARLDYIASGYEPTHLPNGTSVILDSVNIAGNTGDISMVQGSSTLNLIADLSTATAATINQLRYAFQLQKLLEKDALYGSRYFEILAAHFGVRSPDARLQRPEYLGGFRQRVNVDQVLSTTGYDDSSTTDLGKPGANSVTGSKNSLFTKSFVEHGYVFIFAVARHDQTYAQGINRMWTRQSRYDFYFPVFANLGAQDIKLKEIYAQGSSADDNIFGYQEAWAEYRYKPSEVTGYFAPNAGDTILSSWTYTQFLSSIPTLNSDFIEEGRKKIDNTLVVSDSSYQFLCDFYFDMKCTRVMPYYSIPGLLDHH